MSAVLCSLTDTLSHSSRSVNVFKLWTKLDRLVLVTEISAKHHCGPSGPMCSLLEKIRESKGRYCQEHVGVELLPNELILNVLDSTRCFLTVICLTYLISVCCSSLRELIKRFCGQRSLVLNLSTPARSQSPTSRRRDIWVAGGTWVPAFDPMAARQLPTPGQNIINELGPELQKTQNIVQITSLCEDNIF